VRFIHDNAPRGIGVDDVVAAVGGSRRALELRFRKTLGRPVNAEIQRVKVERAKRLLTETDLSIERIAAASGFASSGYLIRLFKRDTGLAPSSYRREKKGAATRFG
jgi:LacI family transcriptional regulator